MDRKVILVTGGSGLLGRAIIDDLRLKGYTAINLDINLREDIDGGEWTCDITSDESVRSALDAIMEQYGRVDGLVNNAYPRTEDWGASFEAMEPTSLRKNIDWQLTSYILLCQQVLKVMKPQKSGSVVNMASIYGIVGNDLSLYEGTSINPVAAYSAIKGGLINFSRHVAALYGPYGIRVNCVSPGGIFDSQPEAFVNAYNSKVPMKRMGLPSDIAPAVTFLLSDEASYITGHNLVVDGGWTAI